MASTTSIEWTESTWNPIVGCSIVSPGCTNCYAMKMAARIEAMNEAVYDAGKRTAPAQYCGTTKKVNGKAVWTGEVHFAGEDILRAPLRRKKPTTYFVNSMGDILHEDCSDEWIDRVFAVMALCPQHTFQVLTKRAKRMREYLCSHDIGLRWVNAAERLTKRSSPYAIVDPITACGWTNHGLPNVWLGVSTERQQEADERIPLLLQTPAAVRFISAEPLLGPIMLHALNLVTDRPLNALRGVQCEPDDGPDGYRNEPCAKLDWVIVGGESGPDARPMHPDWARDLRDQCAAAEVPFFFKQWGEWGPYARSKTDDSGFAVPFSTDYPMKKFGKKLAGRYLDGQLHDAMPLTAYRQRTDDRSPIQN